MIDGDFIVCDDCGDRYHHNASPHDCPGNAHDLADRIDALEQELADLKQWLTHTLGKEPP